MSSIALRGVRAQSEATIELGRKVIVSSGTDNCLLEALETYEVQIDSLWGELEVIVERERREKMSVIEASRERQKNLRLEIEKLERMSRVVKKDELVTRIDELLDENDSDDDDEEFVGEEKMEKEIDNSRISIIEEMKATIRRQINELNSVLSS